MKLPDTTPGKFTDALDTPGTYTDAWTDPYGRSILRYQYIFSSEYKFCTSSEAFVPFFYISIEDTPLSGNSPWFGDVPASDEEPGIDKPKRSTRTAQSKGWCGASVLLLLMVLGLFFAGPSRCGSVWFVSSEKSGVFIAERLDSNGRITPTSRRASSVDVNSSEVPLLSVPTRLIVMCAHRLVVGKITLAFSLSLSLSVIDRSFYSGALRIRYQCLFH